MGSPAMPTLDQNFFPPEKRRKQSVRSLALLLQNFIGALTWRHDSTRLWN